MQAPQPPEVFTAGANPVARREDGAGNQTMVWFDQRYGGYPVSDAGTSRRFQPHERRDMSTDRSVTKDLIQTLEDGKDGFARAADRLGDSDRPDLSTTMRAYSEQRAAFSAELEAMAAGYGDEIDQDGSDGCRGAPGLDGSEGCHHRLRR